MLFCLILSFSFKVEKYYRPSVLCVCQVGHCKPDSSLPLPVLPPPGEFDIPVLDASERPCQIWSSALNGAALPPTSSDFQTGPSDEESGARAVQWL